MVPEGGVCACEACTSASSPCIDVVSGPVSMHVVSFCVLHDLSLVPGTISAAFPLATPTPIGGRMPSVASGQLLGSRQNSVRSEQLCPVVHKHGCGCGNARVYLTVGNTRQQRWWRGTRRWVHECSRLQPQWGLRSQHLPV